MFFLQEKEPAPAPPVSESFRNKKEFYKVVYAFTPRNPDELALNEGDQVKVSSQQSYHVLSYQSFLVSYTDKAIQYK